METIGEILSTKIIKNSINQNIIGLLQQCLGIGKHIDENDSQIKFYLKSKLLFNQITESSEQGRGLSVSPKVNLELAKIATDLINLNMINDRKNIFGKTHLSTVNIFGHCSDAVDSFKKSLRTKKGIWVKDSVGREFYVKVDQEQKTTLNLNEQMYGDICDLHFWYILNPSNQKNYNGWIVVDLPCVASFFDYSYIYKYGPNFQTSDEGRHLENPLLLNELIRSTRKRSPFIKTKSQHTAQEVASWVQQICPALHAYKIPLDLT